MFVLDLATVRQGHTEQAVVRGVPVIRCAGGICFGAAEAVFIVCVRRVAHGQQAVIFIVTECAGERPAPDFAVVLAFSVLVSVILTPSGVADTAGQATRVVVTEFPPFTASVDAFGAGKNTPLSSVSTSMK